MLEIICLCILWKTNGKYAKRNGKKPLKYQILSLLLWFLMETLGITIAVMVLILFFEKPYPIATVYLLGMAFACLGAVISLKISDRPMRDGQKVDTQTAPIQNGDYTYPAMIRVIDESDFDNGIKYPLYLNGNRVAFIEPGGVVTGFTRCTKNTIMIDSPFEALDNTLKTVRFIAVENGYIEIHTRFGNMSPDKFVNKKNREYRMGSDI